MTEKWQHSWQRLVPLLNAMYTHTHNEKRNANTQQMFIVVCVAIVW